MAREHEEKDNSLSGDDRTLSQSGGLDNQWPTHMRNLRRAMIEQFEFEFMRLLHSVQLKETIQKDDVQALTEKLKRAVDELAVQNRSIISEEMAIREKVTRYSLNIDR